MAKQTTRSAAKHGKKTKPRSNVELVLTALTMWFIPVSLFGYIGYTIAVATGHDAFSFMPSISVAQLAAFGAMLGGLLVGGLLWARSRRAPKATRWDDYEAPLS